MRVVLAFAVNTFFNFIIGLLVAKFLGPAEYGRFALAMALAILVQTLLFDWLKLAATRFYSEKARQTYPQLRATLDMGFAIIACGVAVVAVLVVLSGIQLQLSSGLILLAFAAAIANGLFDYNTALVRARFMDQHYARLVIIKNIAALILTGGGAFWFGSAIMTLTGVCLALAGAVLSMHSALHDANSPRQLASSAALHQAVTYAFPVISANVLYQLVPLFNRAFIASLYGFSESGQFSLAYDIGVRIVAAIGSTLDVLLFQIAVAVDEAHGARQARVQVTRNMAVVLAIVAPACTGLWLALPSIEHLLVPEQFRGPFALYLGLLLPGLFCYAMLYYGINPVFQIARRTAPVIFTALIASAADIALVLSLPAVDNARLIVLAQGGMFILAFAILSSFAIAARTHWPPLRDVLAILAGLAMMCAALWPLRHLQPGSITLAVQVVAGMGVYTLAVLAFDIAGLRETLRLRLKSNSPSKSV